MPDRNAVRLVRRLVRQHFGHHNFPGGIYPGDVEFNATLEENDTPVPDELGMRHFRPFLESIGAVPGRASDAYINKFRQICIFRKMGADLGGPAPTVRAIAKVIAQDVENGTWE